MCQKIAVLLLSLMIVGCSHQSTKQYERYSFIDSLQSAAAEPLTWAPIVTAGLIAASGQDKKISTSARKNTPVFSSTAKAEQASDDLKSVLKVAAIVSTAFAPAEEKEMLIVSNIIGFSSSQFATDQLKLLTNRTRPNEKDDYSMPSGHTSQAFSAAKINSLNLEYYSFSPNTKNVLNVMNYSLAMGTAWARVEAGYHYPTDVLLGAALGNFITTAVNNSFFTEKDSSVELYINPQDHAFGVGYTLGF